MGKDRRKPPQRIADIFEGSQDPVTKRLANFPRYATRQTVSNMLARYELFKRVVGLKGSVVECGVYGGFGLSSWLHFSEILEPNNMTRRIYGFDSFEGFKSVTEKDQGEKPIEEGHLVSNAYEELQRLFEVHDDNRLIGKMQKVYMVKGDAVETIPKFIEENRHLVVSLLFLDFDLYEPTVAAIKSFLPRMPKGSILAFDELDNPIFPGETLALLEEVGLRDITLRRFPFDPYIAWTRV